MRAQTEISAPKSQSEGEKGPWASKKNPVKRGGGRKRQSAHREKEWSGTSRRCSAAPLRVAEAGGELLEVRGVVKAHRRQPGRKAHCLSVCVLCLLPIFICDRERECVCVCVSVCVCEGGGGVCLCVSEKRPRTGSSMPA